MDNYRTFENLSVALGLGVIILDTHGKVLFESSLYKKMEGFISELHDIIECEESSRIAFLYSCYQARRFGGRYIFYAPSGLAYCSSPILDDKGSLVSGVLVGPFLLTEHEDYLEFDLSDKVSKQDRMDIEKAIYDIPYRDPREAHGISEHLCFVTSCQFSQVDIVESVSRQNDFFPVAYPLEIENELLKSISKGDIHLTNEILGKMLEQMMFYCGGNLEVLRSRIVELIVLLSRAALKGGGDINSILGLNYEYLKEIDTFSSVEDIALWLQAVIRRFMGHVFSFSDSEHSDTIYRAVEYIKRNYTRKITLKEIADYVFMSQAYLCRIFREGTGQTLGEYITHIRIEESKKLLEDHGIKIVDIPERVGYESQGYFTRVFKRKTGITPAKYRRERR